MNYGFPGSVLGAPRMHYSLYYFYYCSLKCCFWETNVCCTCVLKKCLDPGFRKPFIVTETMCWDCFTHYELCATHFSQTSGSNTARADKTRTSFLISETWSHPPWSNTSRRRQPRNDAEVARYHSPCWTPVGIFLSMLHLKNATSWENACNTFSVGPSEILFWFHICNQPTIFGSSVGTENPCGKAG